MDNWESLPTQEVEKDLDTNIETGLTDKQVEARLSKYGKNVLPQGKVRPWYITFLLALVEPLQIILMIAAVISVLAPRIGDWHQPVHASDFIDFIVIIAIVVIDAVLETVQTVKARKSVDSLKTLSKPRAVVMRDGKQMEIDAADLVPGDIVLIEAGRFIPAELRILESSEFTVDESILTGESLPVNKNANPIKPTTILADKTNICFMNTFAVNGRAVGVVIKTGEETEIGKIAATINANTDTKTPLEKKLTKFSYWISVFAVLIAVVIFVSLYFTGEKNAWSNYLMVAITLAIGVIPESLAAVVSITLSFSTKRLAEENVIVKKLASVETLGSVNVICTDKTGTLTQNRMTVQKVITDNKVVDAKEYVNLANNFEKDIFKKLLLLPNDAVTEGEERIGDPTELALVDFAEKMGADEQEYRKKFKRIDELPFDSERKLMTTVNKDGKNNIICVKGAIDELLKVCDRILLDNKVQHLDEKMKKEILKESGSLSKNALRVLGFAYSDEQKKKDYEKNLIFVGAVGMIDPVRDSAVKAVKEAHDAGIRVVMITGDHPTTALAIAKDLDIAYTEYEVMTSATLEKLNDQQLLRVIDNIKVFARVNPEHKVRIVQALQAKGNITSMTGDGVNDAPSLSIADIGVAMGITGTDVAKQAADVILTDDNFLTMMKGVNEGRNVWQKIRRTIVFLLGINIANVLGILIISLINHTSPLEATDILWINLVVESLLAISMGMGPNDDSLMSLPPIKGNNGLLKGLLWPIIKISTILAGCLIGAFYVGMLATPDNLLTINKDQFVAGSTILGDGPSHQFDSWKELLKCNEFIRNSDAKINAIVYGRTAMFIVATLSPAIIAHIIRLSNWKSYKRVEFSINKSLLVASIIAVVLNTLILFIPGLNDTVFSLVGDKSWTSSNCWVIFMAIGFAFAAPALILLTDAIVFFGYHYAINPWERNRKMVSDLVRKDQAQEKAAKKKNKQKRTI
ncbi:cation-translocating P-type ATPase [Mesoplasma lactucae]|uniref:cation-translocating P-type ATPase n=1 Tax=Mesoplasma lactucae TaxID=138853 RepID=UPI004037A3F4